MKLIEVMNNMHQISIAGYTYFFSYETPIAFKPHGSPAYVTQNMWGKTTGKHINYIKEHYDHIQISKQEFDEAMAMMI